MVLLSGAHREPVGLARHLTTTLSPWTATSGIGFGIADAEPMFSLGGWGIVGGLTMLERVRRVARQLAPHEHVWVTQNVGGGIERRVCERCSGIQIIDVPRPSLRREAAARRLWHLGR